MELFTNGCKWVLDMDNTLANFDQEKNALNRFATEKDFFTNLKPNSILTILQMAIINKQVDRKNIFIVSASPNTKTDKDKRKWIDTYLDIIPKKNILFTRLGQNKAQRFLKRHNLKETDLKDYVLIDDYTKNLVEWKNFGGKVLKYINQYNNKNQHYKALNIESVKC